MQVRTLVNFVQSRGFLFRLYLLQGVRLCARSCLWSEPDWCFLFTAGSSLLDLPPHSHGAVGRPGLVRYARALGYAWQPIQWQLTGCTNKYNTNYRLKQEYEPLICSPSNLCKQAATDLHTPRQCSCMQKPPADVPFNRLRHNHSF